MGKILALISMRDDGSRAADKGGPTVRELVMKPSKDRNREDVEQERRVKWR